MMKYTDEQIDTFLAAQEIKLLPGQRELFKKCVNHQKEDGILYINMGRYNHRAYFKSLVKEFKYGKGIRRQ